MAKASDLALATLDLSRIKLSIYSASVREELIGEHEFTFLRKELRETLRNKFLFPVYLILPPLALIVPVALTALASTTDLASHDNPHTFIYSLFNPFQIFRGTCAR